MKAVWLEDQKISLREDLPMPRAISRKEEALVKVELVGICNTDLELLRGYYPFTGILGHEFVGVIEDCEDSRRIGQKVVGEINAVCHKCSFCQRGLSRHCASRSVLGIVGRNGAFAEYLRLPLENLIAYDASLSPEKAVFTEPVAAACEILEQLPGIAGERVLVVGDGKLGLLIGQVLQSAGCQVQVLGRSQGKKAYAEAVSLSWALAGECQKGSYPYVVECTGNKDGFALAMSFLEPKGTLVLKSTYADRLTLDMSQIVVNEITLVGSRCGPFLPALDLLKEDKVQVTPLIDGEYPLHKALDAFDKASQKGVMKILVRVS